MGILMSCVNTDNNRDGIGTYVLGEPGRGFGHHGLVVDEGEYE